ncbi:MAG: YceI family protein [Candidatus Eremiobacteraeota bacterium]|nr:YceI family protein [Candidatus Eremiobacteraeota bacterium]
MNRSILASTICALALCLPLASQASGEKWHVDPVHSSAEFTATHLMISHVRGTIPIKDAQITIPSGSDIPSSVSATLDPKGVDTHNGMRDDDLRSDHFLNIAADPKMSFESTKITTTDAKHFIIAGNLTMHGQTHPVSLDAQVIGKGPGMKHEPRIAFTASGTIDRSQWGMNYGSPVVGNSITINLEIEAAKE